MIEILYMSKKRTAGARPKFCDDEDIRLKELVCQYGTNNWKRIAQEFNDKNPRQCRDRWNNYLDPSKVRGNWRLEEDLLLIKCYLFNGATSNQVIHLFQNRSSNEIRIRFLKFKRRIDKCLNKYMAKKNSNVQFSPIDNKKVFPLPQIRQSHHHNHDQLIEDIFGKHEEEILGNIENLFVNDFNDELVLEK